VNDRRFRTRASCWLALLLVVVACAATPPTRNGPSLLPMEAPPGPPAWQGPAADAANRARAAPLTPALRALQGRIPLAHIRQGPWSEDRPYEAAYEVAVFDDGTLVYEGHRCVKVGGLVLRHLDASEIGRLREQLAAACVGFDTLSAGEICGDERGLRLSCSNGERILVGTDHCRRDDEQGVRLRQLASALLDSLGLTPWLGEPTQRQACQAGSRDLAPREISRALADG
jgi:hypothetical protein